MYDLFFRQFNKKVPLTMEEQLEITKFLTPKKLRKRQYLLQEADVCKFVAFVEKGLLRQFTLDNNGNERILQFAPEGWTISDLYSFLTAEPSSYHIDALEDCELILINKSAHEALLSKIPKYETYTRLQITGAYIAMQRRLSSIFSATPDERYASFMQLYPDIANRVPQHMIASYMGLQPKTLSRIRRRISNNH
ncbi:cAMP-binding domain of CRP or a regulatory subunit of cAMP-dependent protein kinases [Arachidicoccus rhizosphaerae]|uniref:cAMP-binding domain of CRP or a regulatory subunit of cAMP-dependent protein kinases n=1 Tax=Arachidicoccus rhizosphaerae TaxID=551991 RepID=A0A1H4ASA1_9BACT|nr:Crp/Fnr family transcriptional regulator [Arachidicoccus rhizosphaerae]SEA38769.1 cAMP-binding domain of CRP or a regulatory subunit of cAMP-dependent protein kinases [Arachidicoccus rhizosphaerae]